MIGYVPGGPVVLGVHGLRHVSSNMLQLVGHSAAMLIAVAVLLVAGGHSSVHFLC